MLRFFWRKSPAFIRNLTTYGVVKYLSLSRKKEKKSSVNNAVFIVGNYRSGGGIGRSVERYSQQLGIEYADHVYVDATSETCQPIRRQCENVTSISTARRYIEPATVIVHLNPPHFLLAMLRLGRNFLKNKYIIAYWAWELSELPLSWRYCLDLVDEIEVPSTFTQSIITKYTQKKVTVIAPVGNLRERKSERLSFGSTGKLRCLFIFDIASTIERKNPIGAIESFCLAFSPDEAELTIKIISPQASQEAMEKLLSYEKKFPHVHILSTWLDDDQLDELYNKNDVYLSLHRSEGFGSTIYEAMCKGLYIVATGWSGNMDFMHGDKVFPVSYTMKEIPYEMAHRMGIQSCQWAEPSREDAAEKLRKVYSLIFNK